MSPHISSQFCSLVESQRLLQDCWCLRAMVYRLEPDQGEPASFHWWSQHGWSPWLLQHRLKLYTVPPPFIVYNLMRNSPALDVDMSSLDAYSGLHSFWKSLQNTLLTPHWPSTLRQKATQYLYCSMQYTPVNISPYPPRVYNPHLSQSNNVIV